MVEPPEPMRGLEIPPEVVDILGRGKRPPVTITINGHCWRSRVAIMRGRYLLGLSNANRQAAGVTTGGRIDVDVELDVEPRMVAEPADFAHALNADPIARAAYDRLTDSRKREHLRAIERAKKPETRARRIQTALITLRQHTDAPTPRRPAPGPGTATLAKPSRRANRQARSSTSPALPSRPAQMAGSADRWHWLDRGPGHGPGQGGRRVVPPADRPARGLALRRERLR
jgi:Uncharacterized protein conserved in bacteria